MLCMEIVDKLKVNHYMYLIDVVAENVQVAMCVTIRK